MGEINHLQTEDLQGREIFPFRIFKKTEKWVEDAGGWQVVDVFNILHELQWEGCHGWLGDIIFCSF